MKKIILPLIAASIFTACNNNGEHTANHDTTVKTSVDTTQHVTQDDDEAVVTLKPTFANVDTKAAAAVKTVIDNYLKVKDALVGDNASGAAGAAKHFTSVLSGIDKSLFTTEQKNVYDEAETKIKTTSAQISSSTDIKVQREQFVMLSDGIYTLAKAFGGGRTLYKEHCPMAKDNTGAIWVSQSQDVRNPYFGSDMLECGSVKEIIQ